MEPYRQADLGDTSLAPPLFLRRVWGWCRRNSAYFYFVALAAVSYSVQALVHASADFYS